MEYDTLKTAPQPDTAEHAVPEQDEAPLVSISYPLTAEDYFTCLKTGRVFKTSGTRAVVETVILAVLGAGYLGSYLFSEPRGISLMLAIVCAAFIGVIWIVPNATMRSSAREQASDKIFDTEIYPSRIVIGHGDGQWVLPMDGTVAFWETDRLFILETPENRMTALPKARIPAERLEDVRALLTAHTIHGAPKRRRR